MVQIIKPNHIFKLKPHQFSRKLLKWNTQHNNRKMPWKGINDPYKIWLSEIILQQTRVEQGLDYYNRFIKVYPDINALAGASDDKVFKLWEGLGYYSRCKNLLATARYISSELNGIFPKTYTEILKLKGIGPYTAAAISSFAFALPYAVVDGNVARVLSRIFGIKISFESTLNKKIFQNLAQSLLDPDFLGHYNQAIMDFGAIVCKPAQPLCAECPFKKNCYAFKNNLIHVLPVKKKKIVLKKRHLNYLLINKGDKVALIKRDEKDIWHQLFEFYLVETDRNISKNQVIEKFCVDNQVESANLEILNYSPELFQKLTHQHISCRFIEIKISERLKNSHRFQWVPRSELKKFPFPRIINQYLESL